MKLLVITFFTAILGVFTTLYANTIDESKSDLYYANGIMMKYSEKDALEMWQDEVDNLLASTDEYKNIQNIKLAYNVSQGFLDDLIESLEQVMDNEWGWTEFTAFFTVYLSSHGIQEDWVPHLEDLATQVTHYEESIDSGHGVIVIAHSQGNYYTNEAYARISEWRKPYFHMMGVATPADHVAGHAGGDATAPYVKFYNDFINLVVTGLPANRDDTRHHGFPSVDAHDFYDSYLQEPTTRSDIQQFIIKEIQEHLKAPSQWSTDKEIERNTCDYRITVKHRFDPSLEIGAQIYPFAANQKLYPAKNQQSGETEYVKASSGGTVFTDDWEEKQKNECWMIDNAEKEKITAGIPDYECVIYVEMQYYSGMLKGFFKDERVDCWNSLNRNMDTVYLLNSHYEGDRISTEAMQTILLNDHDSLEILRDQYLQDKIAQLGEGYSYTLEYAVEPFCEIRGETEGFAYVVCTSWKDLLFEAN